MIPPKKEDSIKLYKDVIFSLEFEEKGKKYSIWAVTSEHVNGSRNSVMMVEY